MPRAKKHWTASGISGRFPYLFDITVLYH